MDKDKHYVSLRKSVHLQEKSSVNSRKLSAQELQVVETNEFLASLLNENGLITIGEYTFKVNLGSEKVYALNNEFIHQLEDLKNENVENNNILEFSTDDDVLSIIESGDFEKPNANGRVSILCFREGGANRKDDKFEHKELVFRTSSPAPPTLVMNSDMKHVYQKAGIYFSLMLELKYMWKFDDCSTITCYKQMTTDITANVTYRYRQKCKKNDTGYQSVTYYEKDDNKLNRRLWESASALQLFYLDTKFTWAHKDYDPNLPIPSKSSDINLYLIKDGTRTYHLETISDNL